MSAEIFPKTGDARKIICCTFADDVQEFGEVIEGLALGHDPKDGSWFLTREHDKNVLFPMKPERCLFEEADRAEIDGLDLECREAIDARLERDISNDLFKINMKNIGIVMRETKVDPTDLLRIYEDAKQKAGYDFEQGHFLAWLFRRAARLIETGSPDLPPLAAFGKK